MLRMDFETHLACRVNWICVSNRVTPVLLAAGRALHPRIVLFFLRQDVFRTQQLPPPIERGRALMIMPCYSTVE